MEGWELKNGCYRKEHKGLILEVFTLGNIEVYYVVMSANRVTFCYEQTFDIEQAQKLAEIVAEAAYRIVFNFGVHCNDMRDAPPINSPRHSHYASAKIELHNFLLVKNAEK